MHFYGSSGQCFQLYISLSTCTEEYARAQTWIAGRDSMVFVWVEIKNHSFMDAGPNKRAFCDAATNNP